MIKYSRAEIVLALRNALGSFSDAAKIENAAAVLNRHGLIDNDFAGRCDVKAADVEDTGRAIILDLARNI